jgi:hypothetical protein
VTRFRSGFFKRIKCITTDKRFKGIFKSLGRNPGAVRYLVKFSKLDIQSPKPFLEDVAVRIKTGPALVLHRVGSIHDCQGTVAGLKCRE